MQNNEFIQDTGLNEENSLTHLLDAISPDVENEAVLIEHSKYFDDLCLEPFYVSRIVTYVYSV